MTRRRGGGRTRGLVAMIAVAGLTLGACGGGDSADSPAEEPSEEPATEDTTAATEAPAEETTEETLVEETIAPEENLDPVFGGTLRYAIEAEVDGLNPTQNNISAPGYVILNAVFDPLFSYNSEGVAVPFLAESGEPSEDFKDWTVTLREGVTFHDGTPLNADALLANFASLRASALPSLAVNPFFPAVNADGTDPAIEKVDDLTVIFHLLDPQAYFPANLVGQLGMVASPTWLAASAEDPTLNQAPVGTGPFAFESRSEDSVTRVVRNDDWWYGDVYLDAVEFLPVTDADLRVELMTSGEIDALHTTHFPAIETLEEEGFKQVIDETGEESFGMINVAAPPFDDIRARQALALAAPIEEYQLLINEGLGTRANGRFIPSSPYYNAAVTQVGDDIAAAQPLVAEYCAERGGETNPLLATTTCTDGKINMELQWSGPSVVQSRIADILEAAWSEAGFNVTRQEIPQDDHIIQVAIGAYNVVTWRQFGAPEPAVDNVWLLCRTIGGISLNWPRNCDEARDDTLLAAAASTDPAERASLYQEAEQMIADAYTYIFFNHTRWSNAFADNVYGACDSVLPNGDQARCTVNGAGPLSTLWMD
ncbi:MAG: ABC transporter substrate-binding protein [Actinomycetota bacterium]|nr:ABC transporter substrate-binding protein [Actinomycetota bacterium]MDA3014071.1 ABC transporter substrate-binding protein [Actinomycetota bacterium]MDA3028053.1 ABC transporter substrate-binding protein [Actinomycetota bacterium]